MLYTDTQGKKGVALYDKVCAVCGNAFTTVFKNKELCGHECKRERIRQNSRIYYRRKRTTDIRYSTCVAQGCRFPFTETHHEGYDKTYQLCPSHHASITRGYATLDQVLAGWPHETLA